MDDYMALMNQAGVPPHALHLKTGCICTLMRNMSVDKGLVKNARVIVHKVHRTFAEIRLIDQRTGTLGDIHCLPRIRFNFSPANSSWTFSRLQLPLRLGYACTFHSCVGQTLDRTVLDIRTPVFAHGQLYTAISRVRRREDSRAFSPSGSALTNNIVYKDLILS